MGYFKNHKLLRQLGDRLKSFRVKANLSVQQVHLATGISKGQINSTEAGKLNTSVSHLGLYAELFGVEPYVMLNFREPVPGEEALKQSVTKFLKSNGLSPAIFFKPNEGVTHIIENKLLQTSFLNSPRFAIEIAEFCKEKYDTEFSTVRLSKVLDNLHKKGLIEKISTEKKTKFQYRKK